MRVTTTVMMVLLLAAATGCGHATSVGDSSDTNATPPADEKKSPPQKRERREISSRGAGRLTSDSRENAPVLSTAPGGQLKPHAVEGIQQKLKANGKLSKEYAPGKMDQPTRDALREFQRENNLPATGMPDDVTIQKLGLGTTDIFRSAQDTPSPHAGKRQDDRSASGDGAANPQ